MVSSNPITMPNDYVIIGNTGKSIQPHYQNINIPKDAGTIGPGLVSSNPITMPNDYVIIGNTGKSIQPHYQNINIPKDAPVLLDQDWSVPISLPCQMNT